MAAIQPINEWFGAELKAKSKARSREELRAQKQREKEAEVEYVDGPSITEDEAWFRHNNWAEKRKRVRQALADAGSSQNSLNSFDNCGSDCQVEWSESQERYRVVACYCHNRHCEACMKAKSALITNNLRDKMRGAEKKQHRFITLTLRHSDAPLKQQIKRLYACYKRLRQLPEWKSSQKGGAATLEVKYQPHSKKWHPHLHLISEGSYLSTYWLSQAWRTITGDSHVVDIRLISADKDVAYYVGKYVTKGTNFEVWEDPAVAAEWVRSVKGVRMCATFGSWRGYKLLHREKEQPGEWQHVASLKSLVRRAQAGEVHALELLVILVESQQYNPNRKRSPKPK
jgi:Replication protein